MNIIHAIILGIVEGITEFLPVSSTGHLTIVEKLLGYDINTVGMTAFTAVVQIGAIAAAIVYFWHDIVTIVNGWLGGIINKKKRTSYYYMGWNVIIGSIPVALVGLLLKDVIEGAFRSLWVVVAGLICWSVVMLAADRLGKERRKENEVTWKDALVMGIVQCFSLIPGVSRSGATIAAGLYRDIDRVTATRLSFFLGIPALVVAGGLEAVTNASHISETVGWLPMGIGVLVSFGVGYASIAWLLKFISNHSFTPFVIYRVAVALVIAGLLVAGVVTAV